MSIFGKILYSAIKSVSPESGVAQDFTSGLRYTVGAQDGTKSEYAVSIVFASPASNFVYTKTETEVSVIIKGTTALVNVIVPPIIDGLPVTSIVTTSAYYAANTSLNTVVIPPSVTKIGQYAFLLCSNLVQVTIPSSVKSIGYCSFLNCSRLASITFCEGFDCIDDLAFQGCDALTSVSIPASVTSFGQGVFSRCDALTAIEVNENNNTYKDVNGVLFTKNGALLIKYPIAKTDTSYLIPFGTATIDFEAFSGNSFLTCVTIPASVTFVIYGAFTDCDALDAVYVPLVCVDVYTTDTCWQCVRISSPDSDKVFAV